MAETPLASTVCQTSGHREQRGRARDRQFHNQTVIPVKYVEETRYRRVHTTGPVNRKGSLSGYGKSLLPSAS